MRMPQEILHCMNGSLRWRQSWPDADAGMRSLVNGLQPSVPKLLQGKMLAIWWSGLFKRMDSSRRNWLDVNLRDVLACALIADMEGHWRKREYCIMIADMRYSLLLHFTSEVIDEEIHVVVASLTCRVTCTVTCFVICLATCPVAC